MLAWPAQGRLNRLNHMDQVQKVVLSQTMRKLTVTIPASMTKECFNNTVENLRKIVGNLQGEQSWTTKTTTTYLQAPSK